MPLWGQLAALLSVIVVVVGAAIKVVRSIDGVGRRLEQKIDDVERRLEQKIDDLGLRIAALEFQNRSLLKAFPQLVSSLLTAKIVTSDQGTQIISIALENPPI